jgi:hypothetical protein
VKPGRYLILKHPFWCVSGAEIIVITSYDEAEDSVNYYYPGEKIGYIRRREVQDFTEGIFIPSSSLMELLV